MSVINGSALFIQTFCECFYTRFWTSLQKGQDTYTTATQATATTVLCVCGRVYNVHACKVCVCNGLSLFVLFVTNSDAWWLSIIIIILIYILNSKEIIRWLKRASFTKSSSHIFANEQQCIYITMYIIEFS